ncbi:hypothetical protein J7T55_010672 [Diaporthe amygdali]|uniref:uncharacterized protein n=1 Tax=Phomopsis amygdali TaxID=1214568 RepID=UPI0022FEC459|nr:uncharacterized protein J7T55_010672 [Diaporthe amygdali]KAJ0114283.1 hypothetical protein J7T55_010672 [Diaporthe amygdali]
MHDTKAVGMDPGSAETRETIRQQHGQRTIAYCIMRAILRFGQHKTPLTCFPRAWTDQTDSEQRASLTNARNSPQVNSNRAREARSRKNDFFWG